MAELDVLFPNTEVVRVGDEEIVLTQFKMGHMKHVISLMKKILGLVISHHKADTLKTPDAFVEIALAGWDDLTELLALNVNKPISWVDELEYDKGLELILALIKVNADFFVNRVLPMLNLDIAKLKSPLEKIQSPS